MTDTLFTDADLVTSGTASVNDSTSTRTMNAPIGSLGEWALNGKEAPSSLGAGDPVDIGIGDPSTDPDDEDTRPLPQKDVRTAYAYEQPETEPQGVVKRLIGRLSTEDKATGLKVKGNNFLITFSNNFKDRDGELFTEKAIHAYVARVDMGMQPPPELWVWHSGKGVRIGQAAMVGYHDHFLLAMGEFDTTPQAQNAKAYYAKHQRQTGVSHGFVYPSAKFDGKHFHDFNTYEISLLPKTVAANPFTNLEQVKELTTMALDDKKRQYIKEVFGDEADRVLDTLTESGKALETMQIAYKDFANPSPIDPQTVDQKAVDAVNADIKALIPDLLEGQAEVFKSQTEVMKMMKAFREQSADVLARLEANEKGLRLIKADLPRMASQDKESELPASDLTPAMKNSMITLDPVMTKILGVPVEKTP